MYLTTTGTCVATLTRFGRQVAAENSVNFKITQYSLSDDEIDYRLFDDTQNSEQTDILNTPILEACTLGGLASQKYSLQSFSKETQQVAYLDTDIDYPFVDGDQNKRTRRDKITVIIDTNSNSNIYTFKIRTFYGADSNYIVQSRQPRIITPLKVNYVSEACKDPFENRQNQTEATVSLTWNLTNDTLVKVNSNLLQDISPKTIEMIQVMTGQSTSGGEYFKQEMLLPTGKTVKRGDAIDWGTIGAASCIIHIAGVTTQKGYDIEFLLYNGLILSQREAVVVQQPVKVRLEDKIIPNTPVSSSVTATTSTSSTVSTISYVGGVPGNWMENPEWTSLNKKILEMQSNQAKGMLGLFQSAFLKTFQSQLAMIQRYIFVPL